MRDAMRELSQLTELSVRLGVDEMLVQAGGGNTSLKTESGLWIKASGTRLSDAIHGDIFLLLSWAQLDHWSRGENEVLTGQTPGGRTVRASVETAMHLAMPQRFVAHTHSVRGISWLVCPDRDDRLDARLSGLRWAKLPYVHPGRSLAAAIRDALNGREVDLLLIENHGLVIGAEDSTQLLNYINEVESRLDVATRLPRAVRSRAERQVVQGWVQVTGEVGALAFDEDGLRIAGGGTLYPDHCVYLGPRVAVAENLTSFSHALAEYEKNEGIAAKAMFVKGFGAFLRALASEEARMMLRCLVNVVDRIDSGARIRYLPPREVEALMAWDAEAYRRQIAAEMRSPEA